MSQQEHPLRPTSNRTPVELVETCLVKSDDLAGIAAVAQRYARAAVWRTAGERPSRGLAQETGRHCMTPPPFVISIQSQVVFGHVGNSAALFPMQAAGLEVAAIPTVVLSNTPNYRTERGRALPPEFFSDLLQGARERGLLRRADFILTGYIGSLDVALMVTDFVAEAKAVNPALTYLCDPVMGDTGSGLYVPEAIADVMRDRLLPVADIAPPNSFETELVGRAKTRDDLGPGSGTRSFALCPRGSVDHHRLRA